MRIRRKKWARPELDISEIFIKEPINNKGKWRKIFKKEQPIYLELGCGKGTFIAKIANKNQDINFIGIDIKSDMLGYANRNVSEEYGNKSKDNILLTAFNIEQILEIMDEKDKIDRIYINFCNPWPKAKHKKKRLTHTKQLEKYKKILDKNGYIYFKTDDTDLYYDSLKYFEEVELQIIKNSDNIYENPIFEENIQTEHEKMFLEQGIKIKGIIAKNLDTN